jgi:C-5 cytosine-specific DNA methylase
MRMLELFKGTGSISKCMEKYFPAVDVVSLDIVARFKPTIVSDIMKWDYTKYPTGYFDIIWASPPCTYYSIMQHIASRNQPAGWLEERRVESDKVVQRVLDIVAYFKPKCWLMENPATGTLKNRKVVSGIPWVDVTYCMYGYSYKKQTRIWGNVQGLNLQVCNGCCPYYMNGKHVSRIGWTKTTKMERYSIPPTLSYELCNHMVNF